jgi:hypothetical protein
MPTIGVSKPMQKLRLKWEPRNTFGDSRWLAKAGPLRCVVVLTREGEGFLWDVLPKHGTENSLNEAQLAAEEAAYNLIQQGLEAFDPKLECSSGSVEVGDYVTIEPIAHQVERGIVQSIIPGHSMDLRFENQYFGRVYFDSTRILNVQKNVEAKCPKS